MSQRPVYIDLRKINLPMSAVSSITHRLSGMYVFFVTLPLSLYLLSETTYSKSGFDFVLKTFDNFTFFSFFILLSFLIFWYHILTGVRHLIMDFFHIGETLNGSYYSSITVFLIWFISSAALILSIYI